MIAFAKIVATWLMLIGLVACIGGGMLAFAQIGQAGWSGVIVLAFGVIAALIGMPLYLLAEIADKITPRAISTVAVLALMFAGASSAMANSKPKSQTYQAPCSTVWQATESVVRQHYDVITLDKDAQTGSFTTGNGLTKVRILAFALNGSGESCEVTVNSRSYGLGFDDKQPFLSRIQAALRNP